MVLKEAENIVRSYLLRQKPSAHDIAEDQPSSFSCAPQPEETFEFPGGIVAVEYETDMPLMCVQKHWWLLKNDADYLPEGKKLALVVIVLDKAAQPAEQVTKQKALAAQIGESYPGRFSFFYVGADEATPATVSAAVENAYSAVNA